MSNTNYEQLYHLMSQRRGEELRQMEAFRDAFDALMDTFIETDQRVAECAETQGEPVLRLLRGIQPPQHIDDPIDAFLFHLDHRYHLKRFTAAKAALNILLQEEGNRPSMSALYQKIGEQIGGTKTGAERNLRSFRMSVKEADTDFYRHHLAEYNTNNADFYWNALRLLKQEMR